MALRENRDACSEGCFEHRRVKQKSYIPSVVLNTVGDSVDRAGKNRHDLLLHGFDGKVIRLDHQTRDILYAFAAEKEKYTKYRHLEASKGTNIVHSRRCLSKLGQSKHSMMVCMF